MKKHIASIQVISLAAAGMLVPAVAFAQTNKKLSDIIDVVMGYLDQALVLLMALAVVMFVWNVIQYFMKPDADRKEAGNYVMYSVIGFFVILSLWGIVNILNNTLGLGNAGNKPASLQNMQNIFPR